VRVVTILHVVTESQDGRLHLALRGELDLSTVAKLQAELIRIEMDRPPVVVLDLSRLTFLDSMGLRCVLSAAERAREQERRLVVVRGPDAVQRVFSITRLDERLEMVDNLSALSMAD
jgi:anti-anti-sigma factor